MLLNVRENVLQARPVVNMTFPSETPAAFGLLESFADGAITWLPQFVNALVPPPNLIYFLRGLSDASGNATFTSDSPITLKPFSSKVLFALVLKARVYDANGVAAIYAQTSITFDPSQPLTSLWTANGLETYGNDANSLQLTVQLQRTVANGVNVSFTGSSDPAKNIDIDVIIYDPTGLPST